METANGHICHEFWSESLKATTLLNKYNFAGNKGRSIVRENYFDLNACRYLILFPCIIFVRQCLTILLILILKLVLDLYSESFWFEPWSGF